MRDGSDAVSDWPLLNALLNTAGGATWVSLHHGGGVGMGYSQHAGVVIVCDGTDAAAKRIERVLWNDPATGVMRHADAGYEEAIACAREQGLNLPMLGALMASHDALDRPAQLDARRRCRRSTPAACALDARRRRRARRSAPAPASCSAPRSGDAPVYGVNTGFGKLASTRIDADRARRAAAEPDPLAQRRRRRAAARRRSCA